MNENENNFNDIQVVKVKKRRQSSVDKFSVHDKKKNVTDSVEKLTQRNSVIKEIKRARTKKSKTKTKKNIQKNKIHSLESLKSSLAKISEMVIKQEADILESVTG